ncbi:MAG: hypothetical protein ACOYN0_03095 [Phycisphaerales bacterium]
MPNARVQLLLAAAVLAGACCAGCETRVIKYDPFLAGLPGAESQTPIARDLGHTDPRQMNGASIRRETPEGAVELVAKSGLHVMVHTYNTLVNDEKALFVEQVLSDRTKQEFIARGVDPGELFEVLVREWDEFEQLCLLMPAGEYTPGIFLRPVGGRVHRFELDAASARGMRFKGFDIVMEKGNYRLVRVIDGPKPQKRKPKAPTDTPPTVPGSDSGLDSLAKERR